MHNLRTTRNQWLEAYYSGNHDVLAVLEADDFCVKENNRITKNDWRYQHIERLVKQGKWQPEKLREKDIQFHQVSDTEYRVIATVYSDIVQMSIEEKWRLETGQWRVTFLGMVAL